MAGLKRPGHLADLSFDTDVATGGWNRPGIFTDRLDQGFAIFRFDRCRHAKMASIEHACRWTLTFLDLLHFDERLRLSQMYTSTIFSP